VKTHEDPQNREADRTAPLVPEGHLSRGGDRPGTPGRSLDRYRLKRSVDCLITDDGSVHLLHDGLEQQYEIYGPESRDLLVLDLLRSGFVSEREICDSLLQEGFDAETVTQSLASLDEIGVLERDRGRELLSAEEAERFDRQLIYLADICPQGQSAWQLQRRLRQSHVVVLGCGGLGSWAATGLTLAGVGRLTLVDDDMVELSNLNRQLLFGTLDLGRKKTEAAKESLTAIDPDLQVAIVEKRVETASEVAELVAEADFLVMTADYPPYELARIVNRACISTGTPWISAGQIPPLIRIGPLIIPGQTPCHECQERSFRRQYPRYGALINHRTENPTDASTLGPASGTIGSLIAMEVVHHLTGTVDPPTVGHAIVMDLRTFRVEFEPVEPDQGCYCREPLEGAGTSSIG
jgi:bacteriocin biosynthesis cyclodehydratase domain-containing protein